MSTQKKNRLTWKDVGVKCLWICGIACIMFIMTWIELYTRASDKYTEAQQLMDEAMKIDEQAEPDMRQAKLELAVETYAEVISMHYAPFSPWVRKTQVRLFELGSTFEQQKNQRLAIKTFEELDLAYPPLPYSAFPDFRKKVNLKLAALKGTKP